jgi:hypothetical protein
MTSTFTVECSVHFNGRGRGSRKRPPSDQESAAEAGHVPRVSRLMALAIRFDNLIRAGEVTGQAELANLGHVTRARMSQIMSLLCLAPDVQEEVLFLPRTLKGRDPIQLRHLLPIAVVPDWRKQRVRWKELIHWQTNDGPRVPLQKHRLPIITSTPMGESDTGNRLGRVDPRLSALSIM